MSRISIPTGVAVTRIGIVTDVVVKERFAKEPKCIAKIPFSNYRIPSEESYISNTRRSPMNHG